MIYQSVSIKSVIARIIRNTRMQDPSYLFDMYEWIPEAMGYMRTKFELTHKYADVTINFHKGRLPCDLHHITAVEYNGHRLAMGSTSKHLSTGHISESEQNLPTSTLAPTTTITGGTTWNTAFSSTGNTLPAHPSDMYTIDLGYISTTMADATVRVHYKAVPCDEDGMPLIPDNEDYKQALYYYVRGMMGGVGYKDPIFSYNDLMQRFELHAARAIEQITYPSVDSMENKVNLLSRLIPQGNYFDNFFRADGPEQPYNS